MERAFARAFLLPRPVLARPGQSKRAGHLEASAARSRPVVRASSEEPSGRPLPRWAAWIASLLLCLHATLIVLGAWQTGLTVDEANYFNAGRIILEHGWCHDITVFQGPIPLYANQALVPHFPEGGYNPHRTPKAVLLRGRLGTLPFALLSALLVFLWARRLFGEAAGLLALLFHALNPLLVGFASTLLVDAQHAALTTLSLFCAWRWLETRRRAWLLGIGVTVGLTLSTKYLGLFLLPPVGTAVVVGCVRGTGTRGWAARLRWALAGSGVVFLCLLATMHAAYRFEEPVGSFGPGDEQSHVMERVLETPALSQVVRLFPAPFLRGLDFQLHQGERTWPTYLNGVRADSHATFYLWSILCKTPEVLLFCLALAVVLRFADLVRGRLPGARTAIALTLGYALLLVGYLSLFTKMQLGIRYVMPVYPLLCLWAGGAASRASLGSPRFALVMAALGALLAADLHHDWPDLIAYFNVSSGGQLRAYERFRNTNCDFGQYLLDGHRQLRELYPSVQVLGTSSGARFGLVGADCAALREPQSRWITLEPACGHLGASWWVFDVTPEATERVLASGGSPGLRRDLCLEYLGAGRTADARRHLAHLGATEAAPLRNLIAAQAAVDTEPTRANLEALIDRWCRLGRPDCAEQVCLDHADMLTDSRSATVGLIDARLERRDYQGVLDLFERFPFSPTDPIQFRRVVCLTLTGRYADAREAFEPLREAALSEGSVTPTFLETIQNVEQTAELDALLR